MGTQGSAGWAHSYPCDLLWIADNHSISISTSISTSIVSSSSIIIMMLLLMMMAACIQFTSTISTATCLQNSTICICIYLFARLSCGVHYPSRTCDASARDLPHKAHTLFPRGIKEQLVAEPPVAAAAQRFARSNQDELGGRFRFKIERV